MGLDVTGARWRPGHALSVVSGNVINKTVVTLHVWEPFLKGLTCQYLEMK